MISDQQIDQVVSESIARAMTRPKDWVLIDAACAQTEREELAGLLVAQGLEVAFFDLDFSADESIVSLESLPEARRYWLYLSDVQIAQLLPRLALSSQDDQQQTPLALLPNERNKHAQRYFGVTKRLAEAIVDGVETDQAVMGDLLYCNDELVLSGVALGDMVHARQTSLKTGLAAWQQAWLDWRETYQEIKTSTPSLFKLVTAKKQQLQTAALGILVVPHSSSDALTRSLEENFNFNDGRLNAVVFAPGSLMGYGWHWFKSHVLGQKQLSLLADTFGLVQTHELTISTAKPVDYVIDDQTRQAAQIRFDVHPQELLMIPGRLIRDDDMTSKATKEVFRVQGLAHDDDAKLKANKPLPLFDQAHEEDYKHVFVELRQSALTTSPYVTLMILSTLLATFGLMANSTSVVIGAMILAPLMAPIVSLAMGLARGESSLTMTSSKTLLIGLVLGLLSAMVATWIVGIHHITPEIAGRLNPTLLDLGVAVVSGIAGAYAYAKSEVAKTLAGVAIAVALVPPLAVTGIGLGWMDWSVIYGSFLLFITNLFGIAAAAAITFWVMGYTNFARARKGFSVSMVIVGLITIPLAFSFWQMGQQSRLINNIQGVELMVESVPVKLERVSVKWGREPLVQVHVVSNQFLPDAGYDALVEQLEAITGVSAQYRFSPELVR
ncbi:TIGR00341 family protein [Thiomicrospira sp. ALE5]|uniref:TIGR00341 family protein n=1 Tax=Thiomicrospira sp. ALE5 TaxID=748650 RepID=UPI0008E3D375|nr:TIGR00341 family protein [Thiomicrospira sp. ALE5]SFR60680.1 TIGR00341 family protein [Thiomicrospira sp. ALE5]